MYNVVVYPLIRKLKLCFLISTFNNYFRNLLSKKNYFRGLHDFNESQNKLAILIRPKTPCSAYLTECSGRQIVPEPFMANGSWETGHLNLR